ncbi:NEDD4-binding protein 2-like 1 [Reticulomyxa filosa]|uniref:NEDD4-binding protein 2-like 1 n=1 Tax=Reticulomyxa filosa TaxID=46433 RepID=X6NJJ7_RETFI|nr:NEDD4-binding protein 2-like 1 [Reticulomyxa filosa]|eukprot:ETO25874.1 NEDD4-binding protein 2-like 1 [Reticulomyxa filosa]
MNGHISCANQGEKKKARGLIVLRGLPGSGKTTLARKLAARHGSAQICTEDKYHWSSKEDGIGEYRFRPELVFLAREWCTKEIRACIKKRIELIILDNHNARISMYEDHIQYAVKHGTVFYRNRSYKKFPREVFVKLLKLWEKDPRAELVNPAFDDGSNGESHNNYNNPISGHLPSPLPSNSDIPANHKDKEKADNSANDKERNADSQKESKKSKGMLRTANEANNNEGSGVDSNLRNTNNNAGESAQWETEQPQYPLVKKHKQTN